MSVQTPARFSSTLAPRGFGGRPGKTLMAAHPRPGRIDPATGYRPNAACTLPPPLILTFSRIHFSRNASKPPCPEPVISRRTTAAPSPDPYQCGERDCQSAQAVDGLPYADRM